MVLLPPCSHKLDGHTWSQLNKVVTYGYPRRVLELVGHLQEVELLRAQLGGGDAARRKVLRPVVHHLGNLVPGNDS